MTLRTLIVLAILLLSQVAYGQAKRLREAGNISMVEILVNPEKFHEKKVLVHGILIYEFENNALYLSKQSVEYGISVEALWLNFVEGYESDEELKKLNGKFVSIYGAFDKDHFGHLGAFRGTLNAERIKKRIRYRKF